MIWYTILVFILNYRGKIGFLPPNFRFLGFFFQFSPWVYEGGRRGLHLPSILRIQIEDGIAFYTSGRIEGWFTWSLNFSEKLPGRDCKSDFSSSWAKGGTTLFNTDCRWKDTKKEHWKSLEEKVNLGNWKTSGKNASTECCTGARWTIVFSFLSRSRVQPEYLVSRMGFYKSWWRIIQLCNTRRQMLWKKHICLNTALTPQPSLLVQAYPFSYFLEVVDILPADPLTKYFLTHQPWNSSTHEFFKQKKVILN